MVTTPLHLVISTALFGFFDSRPLLQPSAHFGSNSRFFMYQMQGKSALKLIRSVPPKLLTATVKKSNISAETVQRPQCSL